MISIAIDGPAGAGKSTLARQLAKKLGFLYVDTGAIYRTVALAVLGKGISPEDADGVSGLLKTLDIRMDYGPDGEQRMFLAGEDVSQAIREHQVSGLASKVSAIPAVREFLLEFQRRQAREHSVVMDGRDIGTVVLPDAELKIFMVASVEARARRRYQEYLDKHIEADYDTICEDIKKRDDQDMHRAASPLTKAADAHEIDTSDMSIEEVCAAILSLVEKTIV